MRVMKYEEELHALVDRFRDREYPHDVLTDIAETSRLMAATERLRQTLRRDSHGLFGRDKRSGELEGEGRRLYERARVVKLEDVRILSGHTIIDACVDLEAGDSGDEPIRLFFSFRRQPLAQGGEDEEGVEADDDGDGESDDSGSECSRGEDEPAEEQIMSKDCGASSCKHADGGEACCAHGSQQHTNLSGPPGPFTLVEYSINVARGYGGVTLPAMQIAVQGWCPKGVPSVAGIVSVDDDDVAEHAYALSRGVLADRGYAAVGEEGIELLMTALNIEELDPPKCLAWLLEFPFYEDEWDVVGFALDELVDEQDDDEQGEGSKHGLANGSTNTATYSSDESGVHQHSKAVDAHGKRVASNRSLDTASKPKRQRVEQSKKRQSS